MGDSKTLRWISDEYHDLNGTHYETLDMPPSSLEFSRLVHISRPVVIKGIDVPASALWTNQYLTERMGDRSVSVAVTPNSRADSVTSGPDRRLYFVEPHVEQMSMKHFLSILSTGKETDAREEVYYLQSQNGNMYSSRFFEDDGGQDDSEFEPLRQDVPGEVSWCSEAFDRPPDAVNLWIGDSRSITSIHSDPYENIYTVVRGTKHFTLLPPTEGWCLKERTYPHAAYTRPSPTSPLILAPSPSASPVRWSSVLDPHLPGSLPPEAHPIHITVHAGETLYLPAGWWHHVQQSGDFTIALNWWYDIEIRGMPWVWLSLLRGTGEVPDGNAEEED